MRNVYVSQRIPGRKCVKYVWNNRNKCEKEEANKIDKVASNFLFGICWTRWLHLNGNCFFSLFTFIYFPALTLQLRVSFEFIGCVTWAVWSITSDVQYFQFAHSANSINGQWNWNCRKQMKWVGGRMITETKSNGGKSLVTRGDKIFRE